MDPGRWYTASEAAQAWGVVYDTARKRIARHREKNPDDGLVRTVDAGHDGGRQRLEVHESLVEAQAV